MKSTPSFQFYPADWLRDASLRCCSLAARGLWIDMLCLMHDGEPYGHLKVGSRIIDAELLGRMVGFSEKETQKLLDELEAVGVFSRQEDGTIYSRRMIRDGELHSKRRLAGQAGGKQTPKQTASKPPSKRRANAKKTPSKQLADDQANPQANGEQTPKQKGPPSSSSSSSASSSSSSSASQDPHSDEWGGEPPKPGSPTATKTAGSQVWDAYCVGYHERYGLDPPRNAKANTLCKQLVERLGLDEAITVAGWYPSHRGRWHVEKGHALGVLVTECEALRTQWATGKQITSAHAREEDGREKRGQVWDKLIQEADDGQDDHGE